MVSAAAYVYLLYAYVVGFDFRKVWIWLCVKLEKGLSLYSHFSMSIGLVLVPSSHSPSCSIRLCAAPKQVFILWMLHGKHFRWNFGKYLFSRLIYDSIVFCVRVCVCIGGLFGAERSAVPCLYTVYPFDIWIKLTTISSNGGGVLIVVIVVGRTTKWWHVIGINEYGNLPSSILFTVLKKKLSWRVILLCFSIVWIVHILFNMHRRRVTINCWVARCHSHMFECCTIIG